MSAFYALRSIPGPIKFVISLLVIIMVVLIPMFATSAIPGQEPRITTANNQNVVGHASPFQVVVQLPVSITDDSLVVPMTMWPSWSEQLIYQGEPIIERSIVGSGAVFQMDAIGFPHDTSVIVLVTMSRSQAESLKLARRDAANIYHVSPDEYGEIIDRHQLIIVGA